MCGSWWFSEMPLSHRSIYSRGSKSVQHSLWLESVAPVGNALRWIRLLGRWKTYLTKSLSPCTCCSFTPSTGGVPVKQRHEGLALVSPHTRLECIFLLFRECIGCEKSDPPLGLPANETGEPGRSTGTESICLPPCSKGEKREQLA